MLNFFVSVLLIVKGITASYNCNNRCNTSGLAIREFPETNEDLQKICKPYIEYIDCEIHKEKICQRLNPRIPQMGIRLISTMREVCSEYTLLHAVEIYKILFHFNIKSFMLRYLYGHSTSVVDNLKCWNGKLRGEDNRECSRRETESDRVKKIAEALSEKGLKSLAENGYVSNNSDSCSGLMNFYACQSFVIKRTCGAVAMSAYVEILRNVRPFGYYYLHCEDTYALLQFFIHHRKPEEEKERNVAAIFRKRK